jgi:hypothetical protein
LSAAHAHGPEADARLGNDEEQQYRKNYTPILASSQKSLQNPT